MAWSYYIYYRVDATRADACAVAVQKLLSDMQKRTGIQGRVLKKRNEPLLWMEIYEPVADEAKFEWELAEAVAASGITALLQEGSARHTECFAE
jgi:phosphoribosyl-dephospho-CoA transferase